ncbi:hypothetical protein GA0115235_112414 [Streptomyces sp. DpondAA-F4a]|nr:hypothetical protein GA0115235_112414 [Streptomyces sp. DpondAA-F4a]
MTDAISRSVVSSTKLAMMMISGSPGMTRKTLENIERISSAAPPRNPAVTPMSTDSTVARNPAMKPTRSTPRVPTRIWESTS